MISEENHTGKFCRRHFPGSDHEPLPPSGQKSCPPVEDESQRIEHRHLTALTSNSPLVASYLHFSILAGFVTKRLFYVRVLGAGILVQPERWLVGARCGCGGCMSTSGMSATLKRIRHIRTRQMHSHYLAAGKGVCQVTLNLAFCIP